MGFITSLRAAHTNLDNFCFVLKQYPVFTANSGCPSVAIYYQGLSALDPKLQGISYTENFAYSPICEDAKENPFSIF